MRRFDLTVVDPQNDGMGEGEYSPEGFLRGWNTGNAFAHRAIGAQNHEELPLTYPSKRIREIWEWNYSLEKRQESEEFFIPRISFFRVGDSLATGVIWVDAIPALLPVVDLLFIPREELAPKRWFRKPTANAENPDVAVFSWQQIQPLLGDHERLTSPMAHLRVMYDDWPPALESTVRAAKSANSFPENIPFDGVLDDELVRGESLR